MKDGTLNRLYVIGYDENLEDQNSDEAPVEIYFGLVDTCHDLKDIKDDISSLFTSIEIVIEIKDESCDYYSRVMRFIKLFTEERVWHDNTIQKRVIY